MIRNNKKSLKSKQKTPKKINSKISSPKNSSFLNQDGNNSDDNKNSHVEKDSSFLNQDGNNSDDNKNSHIEKDSSLDDLSDWYSVSDSNKIRFVEENPIIDDKDSKSAPKPVDVFYKGLIPFYVHDIKMTTKTAYFWKTLPDYDPNR